MITEKSAAEEAAYKCGILSEVKIANQDLLQSLKVGDGFTAGGFPVIAEEVQGSDGKFSGKGFFKTQYLKKFNIAVTFDNITINTDRQMIKGEVVTTYDASWGGILDGDKIVEDATVLVKKGLKFLSELSIDKSTLKDIEKTTAAIIEQAKKELPEKLQKALTTATTKMISAKKAYDTAKKSKDKKAMEAAKGEFEKAKGEVAKVSQERDEFIAEYGEIIEKALLGIVKDEKEIESLKIKIIKADQAYFKNPNDGNLKKISIRMIYYSVAVMSNYFKNLMNTEDGRNQLALELKKGNMPLGKYIYKEINEKKKTKKELIDEVKIVLLNRVLVIIKERSDEYKKEHSNE